MPEDWDSRPFGEFQCAECGTLYEVTVRRVSASARDEAICEVCRRVMNSWRGTMAPSYILKSPAQGRGWVPIEYSAYWRRLALER